MRSLAAGAAFFVAMAIGAFALPPLPHHTEHVRTYTNPNQFPGISQGQAFATLYSNLQVVALPINAVDTGGGQFSWQNPESTPIIVDRIVVDVTTAATASCTLNAGTTATSATTSSSNLINALDEHSATGTFDNFGSPGTAGKFLQKLASGKWVTGTTASGASAGIVGTAYIFYTTVSQ